MSYENKRKFNYFYKTHFSFKKSSLYFIYPLRLYFFNTGYSRRFFNIALNEMRYLSK